MKGYYLLIMNQIHNIFEQSKLLCLYVPLFVCECVWCVFLCVCVFVCVVYVCVSVCV